MRAMSCRGDLHFWQTTSKPKVFFRSCKAVQLVGHELGQRASAGLVGPLLLEGQQVSLDYLEKGSLLRLPARVHQAGT